MLLAYDKTSGQVLWNSGTNSAYPDGPPDFVAYEATGRTDVGLKRINDDRDAVLVTKIFTNLVTISTGKIIVGELIGAPDDGPSVPVSPATAEQLMTLIEALQNQQDALTAQQAALQQQSDDLMLMMFGGGAE